METQSSSPSPKDVIPTSILLTFGDCVKKLATQEGLKARRLDWKGENAEFYITVKDSQLMLYRPDDTSLHPMIVSSGDILAEDWFII